MKFAWDEKKANINFKKHKISFEEAKTVFFDPNALLIADPEHSDVEDRFIIMGLSNKLKILTVCHCYHENEEVIRIISARKANSQETKTYKKGKR